MIESLISKSAPCTVNGTHARLRVFSLRNKKFENFFQIPKYSLSICLKLSVSSKRTLLLARGKKIVTSEVTGYFYAVA
jgi:hypothetical protein